MATNKETMNVIAKGMEKEVTGRELTELNEMPTQWIRLHEVIRISSNAVSSDI